MKYFIPISLSLCLIFSGCGSEDEPSVESTDITGEYQGRLTLSTSTGEQGIVLYRFENSGDNVFTGFYEGIEFGQVTVTQNLIEGVPSNGNQAFSSLVGQVSETGISFSLFDADGNTIGVFGGSKITDGNYAMGDITINGKTYISKDDFCAFGPGGFGVTNEYERLGDVEQRVFFYLNFESEPSTGSYSVTTGAASSSSFSAEISYLGETIEATSGFASVSNPGNEIFITMNDVSFDPTATNTVVLNAVLICNN